MRFLRSNYDFGFVLDTLVARFYSTDARYVNQALGGKLNFEKDFSRCHIETSNFQKFLLGVGSSFFSITDPSRGDMIAVMGESTGYLAFDYIRSKMLQSEEGRQVLEEKPRISSKSVNLKNLSDMPEGTLGKAYSNFLRKYKYSPDSRLAVRFVDDFELAYVAQRYREAHDLFHTLLDMPTNMLGEVSVKWVEAIQTRLPMCITGALFGPLRLAPKLTRNYSTKVVATLEPDIIENLENKKISLKKLPSKIQVKRVILPLELEEKILSILKEENFINDSEVIKSFKENTYKKILLHEGIKEQLMRQHIHDQMMNHLLKSRKEEEITERDKQRVSVKVNKYMKGMMKAAAPKQFNKKNCLLYLSARAPYEYAAVMQVFLEIYRRDPQFQPRTFCDFGSGVGTVYWAASNLWKENIVEYFTVDSSRYMNDLALRIISKNTKELVYSPGFYQRQFLPYSREDFDIVISAFTFLNLGDFKTRIETARNLWNKTKKYFILIENGTNDGFEVINEMRDVILDHSHAQSFHCHVFAPCPHDLSCPRAAIRKSPCNFLSSYKELKFKREEVYLGTPYSYIIFKKEKRHSDDAQWPRIVRETLLKKKHVICRMCTKEGKLEEVIFTAAKHGKITYKCAKKLLWGDLFPGNISSYVSEANQETDDINLSASSEQEDTFDNDDVK